MKQVIITLILILLSSCSFADLRSDKLVEKGMTSEARENAIKIMSQIQMAHGFEQWKTKKTTSVLIKDNWESTLIYLLGREPWDNDSLLFNYENNTFNGSLLFLSGDRKNETVGIQSWISYEITDEFEQTDNGDLKVAIPAFIYLNELPFRIEPNELLINQIDDAEFQGKNYLRLFYTWKNFEPNSNYDQYILWIDPETYLIRLAEFTTRTVYKFAKGVCIFDDYKLTDGIQLARKQSFSFGLDPDYEESFIHQVTISSVKYDHFYIRELHKIKGLKMYKDEKPITD